jgi:adenylate cyclase
VQLTATATPLDRIESLLLDWRFLITGKAAPPADPIIVAIDEATVKQVGAYPLPRSVLADLILKLSSNRARAVGLDLLLLEQGLPFGDSALAAALAKVPSVVGAVATFDGGGRVDSGPSALEGVPNAEAFVLPIDQFREVASVGIVNIATDSAGTVRHIPLLVRSTTTLLPSFALQVAAAALRAEPIFKDGRVQIGAVTTALDVGDFLPLRFFGPRGTIPTLSASKILNGEASAQVAGKIALIGATVTGGADSFATPFEPVFPGVEVLATAVAALVSGETLIRNFTTRVIDAAAIFLLPITALVLLSLGRLATGIVLVSALAALWIGATLVAFDSGFWLSATLPIAALLPPAAIYCLGRIRIDSFYAKHLAASEAAFRLFHPPALAARLAKEPGFLSKPVEQTIAILFIDLSGFTHLSEILGLHETRAMLKQFHDCVAEAVEREAGIVLTFMGDGAMAAFGLPSPRDTDAGAALSAALYLRKAVHRIVADFRSGAFELRVRIGVHVGPVIVSRLGHAKHQQITATGDAVNVASRLMEVAKEYHTDIVVSNELFNNALAAGFSLGGSDRFSEERSIFIRGRSQPLSVRLWLDPAQMLQK